MDWIFGYLLIGFALSWFGFQVMKCPPNKSSWWELAACILWPLAVLCAVGQFIASTHRRLRNHARDAARG